MCMKLGPCQDKMRELNKEPRRQRQLHRPKKIGFLSKTKALHVHHASFASTARLRRENLLIRRFIEVVNIQRRIFLSLYNLNKILKNSEFWIIKGRRFFLELNFNSRKNRLPLIIWADEKTQIQFFNSATSLLPLSWSLLKLPNNGLSTGNVQPIWPFVILAGHVL